jgi:site-specific DNA-adenine methylase
LQKETLYNTVKQSDYSPADDYLTGLEIRQSDYRELYKEFANNKNVFFILDPPYLSTDAKSYTSFWKLRDYLDVLKCLSVGSKYAYFTSDKSTIVELMECLERNYKIANPFAKAKKIEQAVSINKTAGYTDIMLVAV